MDRIYATLIAFVIFTICIFLFSGDKSIVEEISKKMLVVEATVAFVTVVIDIWS